jgi:hypothetical protein
MATESVTFIDSKGFSRVRAGQVYEAADGKLYYPGEFVPSPKENLKVPSTTAEPRQRTGKPPRICVKAADANEHGLPHGREWAYSVSAARRKERTYMRLYVDTFVTISSELEGVSICYVYPTTWEEFDELRTKIEEIFI